MAGAAAFWQLIRHFFHRPTTRQTLRFARHYSAQLGFTALVVVFLMITVGEGQAYDPGSSIKIAAALPGSSANSAFFGKPQILSDQTVSTGEVQQQVAIIYQVAPGDTYSSIAQTYNVHVESILQENNIADTSANNLTAGTQLLIPATDTNTSSSYLVALNQLAEQQAAAAAAQQAKLAAATAKAKKVAAGPAVGTVVSGVVYLGTERGAYNGGDPGQCTWFVNSVRHFPGPMGNANNYLASARAYGLATGSVARVGAVIQTRESGFGHVGIVVGVSGNSVTIKEMNYLGPYKIDERTINADSGLIAGYIY